MAHPYDFVAKTYWYKDKFTISLVKRHDKKELALKSPSLFIYKPTLDSLYSILIRILGFYFFILLIICVFSFGSDTFLETIFYNMNLGGGFFKAFVSIYSFLYSCVGLLYSIFLKNILLQSLIVFISFAFLLNHMHLGYRHSFVRSRFKGELAYPFHSLHEGTSVC